MGRENKHDDSSALRPERATPGPDRNRAPRHAREPAHDPDRERPPEPDREPEHEPDRERFEGHLKRKEYYRYDGPPDHYRITKDEKRGRLRMTEVRFPSLLPSGDERIDTAIARLFWSSRRFDRQPIVFLPGFGPWKTAGWESFVATLASTGHPTLLVTLPHLSERASRRGIRNYAYMSTKADIALPAYEQAVSDVRAALHWLMTEPEPIRNRGAGSPGPALVGVSFGALVSILVGALEPRFESVVTILGGGDLDIIVFKGAHHTTVPRELKEAGIQIESRRLARAQFQEYLSEVRRAESPLDVLPSFHFYLFDPLTFASHLRSRPVLMINALFDPIMPAAAARQLWLELGKPRMHWFWGTHWAGGPWKPYVIGTATRFLSALRAAEQRVPADSWATPWPH